MSIYFLDSSALVKRYIPETGTAWILSLCTKSSTSAIFIAKVTPVELISAFARQYHDGEMKLPVFQGYRQLVLLHNKNQYQVMSLSSVVVLKACDLHESYRLRAYDSVQLASALELQKRLTAGRQTLTFVSADARLLQAATSEGLTVDNPNNYP